MNIQSARIVEITIQNVTGLGNKQYFGTSNPMVVVSGFNGDFPSAPTAARSKPVVDGIPNATFNERFYFVVPDSCRHFGCFVYDSNNGQKGTKMGSCRVDVRIAVRTGLRRVQHVTHFHVLLSLCLPYLFPTTSAGLGQLGGT